VIPPDIYAALDAEFHFDFDPCPHPRPKDFNGLSVEWGQSNWVNPPFRGAVSQWVKKALTECKKGKLVVFILPCYLNYAMEKLDAAGAEFRWAGYVRFLSLEDGLPNQEPRDRLFPCLIIILRPRPGDPVNPPDHDIGQQEINFDS
jgi:hypothetical protein